MKLIRGNRDTSDGVELWALGEYRWKLDIEMENANQENETINQTFRDIMDSLTEEEKEKIIRPWPPEVIIDARNLGDNVRKLNSRFDLAGSIEDFDRLKQFFQIRENEVYNLMGEIVTYATPDEEGFKVDDKYLRQKVVEVDGNYMVPKTLAPILKTILQKYGDLGGNSSLTRGMKSVASTLLSIIIDKMCRTKVEDVRKEDLQEWFYYLQCIKHITGFDLAPYFETLFKIMKGYLGFKAIRCRNDVRERLDMWIATFERFKKNREELDTLEPSSMMEEFLIEASKWKRKTIGDLLV